MRLSEYTDYTLRVLMYCAAHRDRLVTIGELAEQHPSWPLPTGADLVNNTGSFILLLATFVDGVKTLQNGQGPVGAILQDNLDGSGDALLVITFTAP